MPQSIDVIHHENAHFDQTEFACSSALFAVQQLVDEVRYRKKYNHSILPTFYHPPPHPYHYSMHPQNGSSVQQGVPPHQFTPQPVHASHPASYY